jgi:hypothetical protein
VLPFKKDKGNGRKRILPTLQLEPCGLDFLTSVEIGFGFLLKCRFSVGIGFGFEIEKSHQFVSGFL